MDRGFTFSLHLLLLDHDLAGLLRSLWRGVRVDDDTLALDVTRAVGPRGSFLTQRHTARHCRSELWKSRYFYGATAARPQAGDDRELWERLDEDLREILRTHRPEPLPAPLRKRINSILEKSGASPVA